MKIQLMLAAAALVLGLSAAKAEVVVINFEDLAPNTSVTSQYASLGVHFSTSPIVAPNGVLHSSVEVFSYPFGNFGTKAAGLWGSAILLAFDSDVSNFSVLMNDTERGTLLGRVRAYDVHGNLFALVTDMTGPYNTPWFYQGTLQIPNGGIRFIELTSDADGAVFDNITFTRIPSPAAAALLPVCLLGLGKRRR
ncbi:MAG: hypothetical protein ACREJD_04945 [Phycisphaerales bacterium]